MSPGMLPVAKSLYVCDEVIADPATGKPSLLNLWDTVRLPPGASYPYQLDRICAFAWLRDGSGDVVVRIDMIEAATGQMIRRTPSYPLHFPSRTATRFTRIRIEGCVFPAPGLYILELYCQNRFVDDQTIRLLPAREGTSE